MHSSVILVLVQDLCLLVFFDDDAHMLCKFSFFLNLLFLFPTDLVLVSSSSDMVINPALVHDTQCNLVQHRLGQKLHRN